MKGWKTMKKWILVFLCLFLVACGKEETAEPKPEMTENGRVAEQYLEKQQYPIVSYEGEYMSTLTLDELTEDRAQNTWGVQSVSPDEYVGKTIYYENFTVKDHPIGEQSPAGQTAVSVMVVDGEVIGGTSFPVTDGSGLGSGYSLSGKSFEDIHPDIQEWQEAWDEKYGN